MLWQASCVFVIGVATVAAQTAMTWVPTRAPFEFGIVVRDSPRPLHVLQGSELQFGNGAFHYRPSTMLAAGNLQTAVYDPTTLRTVALESRQDVMILIGGSLPIVSMWCEVFDGARWRQLPVAASAQRHGVALAFDQNSGRMLWFGGLATPTFVPSPLTYESSTWALVGDAWTQLPVSGPPARAFAAMAGDPGGGVVLHGGEQSSGLRGDTWVWNGVAWSPRVVTPSPAPRARHAMALDPASGQTVLYGGVGAAGPLYDAWSWDGAAWTPLSTQGLVPLAEPQLVREGGGRILLLGTDAGAPEHRRMFAWTGSAWRRVWSETLPRHRWYPGFAYDETREEVVMFGGWPETSVLLGDTWVYRDGWRQRFPATSPSPRRGVAMAFDPVRDEVVMFGGIGVGAGTETWVWNGADWSLRTPVAHPTARSHAGMAFDPVRSRMVLYGGWTPSGSLLNDTWEWDGQTWTHLTVPALPTPEIAELAFDANRGVMMLRTTGWATSMEQLWELGPSGWVMVSPQMPGHPGDYLTYDPVDGGVCVFAWSTRYVWLQGAWHAAATNREAWQWIYPDHAEGRMVAIGRTSFVPTDAPAQAGVYGHGCGPLGETTLAFDNRPVVGAVVYADVRCLEANAAAWLFVGLQGAGNPITPECDLYVGAVAANVFRTSDAYGWARFDTSVPPAPALVGVQLFAQAVVATSAGLGFSNGARLRIGW